MAIAKSINCDIYYTHVNFFWCKCLCSIKKKRCIIELCICK